MRVVRAVCYRILPVYIVIVIDAVWAHDHSEMLSHHWEVPAYIQEVHFQLGLMAIAACIIAVIRLIRLLKGSATGR